jgi:hypothetical protein
LLFAAMAFVILLITTTAQREIETALDTETEAAKASFCAQYGGAQSGTDAHAACANALTDLMKRDQERRASSGLF